MKYILLIASLILSHFGFSQEQERQLEKLDEKRKEISNGLAQQYRNFFRSSGELELEANSRNIPIYLFLEDGKIAKLNYFDEFGNPSYYKTFNVGAAQSIGTNSLQVGGSLGLNLTGRGITVGIYDQTRPRPNHAEFQGRLTQIDGSTEIISDHATHVTGTVLATGLNSNARGMATEATGWAFNWESDVSKMNENAYDPITKPNGHILSNHSYGIVIGWYRNNLGAWVWAGNANVDENTDYRFGFYSEKSKALDDLLFSKPYYTSVWAAGNDRADTGNGTRPSDGPEDTIGPEGVAKNVITVGAVNKVNDYTGPGSVQMSSFSSWGPTDDGRIKPDIVGIGVNVFSSTTADEGNADSYASQSGTSMSAPNVSGSLLLLQQLYNQRNNNKYMFSATLKALMINTAKEAGSFPGPDYIYGWGLMDTKAAAEIVLNEDGGSALIRELLLSNGGEYKFDFISDGVIPIRATIAWTDPSGNPPPQSLNPTNLMLVNDLDMRIVDEDGRIFFPWSLDPTQTISAQGIQTQDNFRDNVEQVEIFDPAPKKYSIIVSHKGNLVNGAQEFSLVMTAGVQDGVDETLFWIGGSTGDWNNPQNWAFSAGGQTANKIPGPGSRVVFEGNAAGTVKVNFPMDAAAFSVNLFGDRPVEFDLQGNDIMISSGFRVSNAITKISNGRLLLSAEGQNENLLDFGKTQFENLILSVEKGNWKLIGSDEIDELNIGDAVLNIDLPAIKLNSISLNENATLIGAFDEIEFSNNYSAHGSAQIDPNKTISFSGVEGFFQHYSATPIAILTIKGGKLTLNSQGIDAVNLASGELIMNIPELQVKNLVVVGGSTLNFGPQGKLTVADSLAINQSGPGKVLFTASQKGEFVFDVYEKFCFTTVDVNNVDLIGQAIINLGVAATVTNSQNWFQQDCNEVLFAKFESEFTCVGAFVAFENLSEGEVSEYLWDFGGLGTSTEKDPFFTFNQSGNYTVSLEITNSFGSTRFDQTIAVTQNSLVKPNIVINGVMLTSQTFATRYQWFLNGQIVEGATERSIEAIDGGNYQVAIFDDECNSLSDAVVITSIETEEPEIAKLGIFIGPNPTDGRINVSISNENRGPLSFEFYDMSGRSFGKVESYKSNISFQSELELNAPKGVYMLIISSNNFILHYKIIKN